MQHTTTHCNTLQHTTTHCNILQTHCNTLQHTTTRSRRSSRLVILFECTRSWHWKGSSYESYEKARHTHITGSSYEARHTHWKGSSYEYDEPILVIWRAISQFISHHMKRLVILIWRAFSVSMTSLIWRACDMMSHITIHITNMKLTLKRLVIL